MELEKIEAVVTEKDLLRAVASNLTKELMMQSAISNSLNQEIASKSKQILLNHIASGQRVWRAFEKAIVKSIDNGKAVDTGIIGLFRGSNN
jgi:hypothetical protein